MSTEPNPYAAPRVELDSADEPSASRAEVRSCPPCGTYVTPGASDCAKCGHIFKAPDESETKAHEPLLSGLLILVAFGTVVGLGGVLVSSWSGISEGNLEVLVGLVLVVGLAAIRLFAIWGIRNWKRWAVYTYFTITFLSVASDLAAVGVRWGTMAPTVVALLMTYLVYRDWNKFE